MNITKKLYMIFLPILALILLLLPCTAFAQATQQETEIAQLAQANENVKMAKCLIHERTCILAIQTEKFTDKSAYEQFRTELENEILQKYNLDTVMISRSPKVMHAISKLEQMSDSEREQAIEKILKLIEHPIRPPMIQPR